VGDQRANFCFLDQEIVRHLFAASPLLLLILLFLLEDCFASKE
jgi:hypothetical protein